MTEFIQDLCNWKNTLSPTDCITILIAFLTLIATIYIPKRIMQEQTYQGLLSDCRSYDYAVAIQSVIEFFTVECKGDINNVAEKYKERFFNDIYGVKKMYGAKEIDVDTTKSIEDIQKWYDENKGKVEIAQKEPALCLHYQRRFLAQFFYQLDLCARFSRSYRKRIQRDFTTSEANLIRILIAIDEEINADDILKKSLDSDFRVRQAKYVRGMNTFLAHLYHILRESKPQMQY